MRHTYLHVPFCARRCSYCDFAIAVRKTVPAERYVTAVRRELERRRDAGEVDDLPVETIYFGGGTPSLLPAAAISELLGSILPPSRPSGIPPEITLEANPDDVSHDAALGWVAAGVNRISLGAQSFHPAALRWMHRTHDVHATGTAVRHLRDAGIASLSVDLIFGLPDELGTDFARDLDAALALEPDHLSIYGLAVEPRTPLARWISRGATAAPSEDRYSREFLLAHETVTAAGFEHYEVSNYARPGRRSRHNSAYWLDSEYLGLGPAAHSYRGGERRWNLRDWTSYERAVQGGQDPTEQRELLGPEARELERLYLGLRTSAGLPRPGPWQLPAEQEARWRSRGWLADGPALRLTPSGWLYLDELVASLTTSARSG